MRRCIVLLVGICLMTALVGCNRGSSDLPETFPVSIKITYKGQPVEGATVSLIPQTPDGKGASGITDSSGTATVRTFTQGEGALPGTYKVTVVKTQSTAPEVTAEDEEAYEEAMETEGEESAFEPKDLLPVKYKSAETTDLECTVSAEGDNQFEFDLTD
ncbi:MAG: carboxypeptidase regulatory-like domain-containing protein [Planctomycetota bacterium]|nr:MAG: carboxypeptidase regulatory-like domain-containing protein [Planctomycetota bacterium]